MRTVNVKRTTLILTGMNATADEDGHPVRTDGGSPMPGVPAGDTSEEPGTNEATDSEETGKQMPGVPGGTTRGQTATSSPEPAAEASGESCGSPEEETADATDELTTAFTFEALTHVRNPQAVVNDARTWSDWVGVVGDVDAPTLNTFLRRNQVDIDFFNGARSPADRLRQVTNEADTFHSERLVLVGVNGQEDVAEAAGWEFQPLEPTAEEAGWEL